MKMFSSPRPKTSLAFLVNPLPIIRGILPPALTSSGSVFGFSSNSDTTSPFLTIFLRMDIFL